MTEVSEKKVKETTFFYLIMKNEYIICDFEYCEKGERTIDIEFNKLADNKELLDKLKLVSMFVKKPDGIRWFASYLSAFDSEEHTLIYDKLLTNPTVRILIQDEKLFEEIKKIEI